MKAIETDTVVVGGGISGCMVTMQLLKHHPQMRICMVEKDAGRLARGVAYARHFTGQLLNVPVAGMSIDPEQPAHFYNWLRTNAKKYPQLVFDAHTFVPRSIYGDYVEEQFTLAVRGAGDRFRQVTDEAICADRQDKGWVIVCKQENEVRARRVVLSTGNLPPADITIKNSAFLRSPLYVSNPWTPGVIRNLAKDQDVLLIGSGLTAVDIVIALHDRQHHGKIYLLSRRGKLPLPHAPAGTHQFSQPEILLSGKVRDIVRTLRSEIEKCSEGGIPWQQVMDSIRPWTQKAWRNLDMAERNFFLTRLRSYWEIHRHRLPVESLEKIGNMKATGQLVHFTGNIDDVTENGSGKAEATYIHRNTVHRITAGLVINCTGPENNFRKHNMPLLVDMMKKGYVVSDELNLGIGCDAQGKVINQYRVADDTCFCMGHLRKGTLWETTAVRELREQAKEITQLIS